MTPKRVALASARRVREGDFLNMVIAIPEGWKI
jgi:hypothetical protein